MSIDNAKFAQKWWRQKWKKGQGSSGYGRDGGQWVNQKFFKTAVNQSLNFAGIEMLFTAYAFCHLSLFLSDSKLQDKQEGHLYEKNKPPLTQTGAYMRCELDHLYKCGLDKMQSVV